MVPHDHRPPPNKFSLSASSHRDGAGSRLEGQLPHGVYSDMFGAGDEGVRTDINRTYTVRRGSVIVRFTGPRSQRVPRAARMIGLQGESTVANAMSQRTRAAEARRVAVLLLALTGMLLLVRYLSID